MLSVSSRLGALPYLSNPLQKNQFILDENSGDSWVRFCIDNKSKMIESFIFDGDACNQTLSSGFIGDIDSAINAYEQGKTPWPITYHFMPDELKNILQDCGVRNVSLAGPGVFARTIPNEILVKIMKNPAQRSAFLDFCHEYDSNPYVCGMGKNNLLAKGDVG